MVSQEELDNASWRKSTWSDSNDSGCVSIALLRSHGAIRDSTDPTGPIIVIPRGTLSGFLHAVKAGKFDEQIL